MSVKVTPEEFARKHGFAREDILTEKARQGWLKWKAGLSDKDDWVPPTEDHDTIGMVALDAAGLLSGACTTSGLAFKIHGRVGDSPIIGSGMYVDNKVGAAAATGRGEAVIKVCGKVGSGFWRPSKRLVPNVTTLHAEINPQVIMPLY